MSILIIIIGMSIVRVAGMGGSASLAGGVGTFTVSCGGTVQRRGGRLNDSLPGAASAFFVYFCCINNPLKMRRKPDFCLFSLYIISSTRRTGKSVPKVLCCGSSEHLQASLYDLRLWICLWINSWISSYKLVSIVEKWGINTHYVTLDCGSSTSAYQRYPHIHKAYSSLPIDFVPKIRYTDEAHKIWESGRMLCRIVMHQKSNQCATMYSYIGVAIKTVGDVRGETVTSKH